MYVGNAVQGLGLLSPEMRGLAYNANQRSWNVKPGGRYSRRADRLLYTDVLAFQRLAVAEGAELDRDGMLGPSTRSVIQNALDYDWPATAVPLARQIAANTVGVATVPAPAPVTARRQPSRPAPSRPTPRRRPQPTASQIAAARRKASAKAIAAMKRRGVTIGTQDDRAYAREAAEYTPGTPLYFARQTRLAREAERQRIQDRNKKLAYGAGAAVLAYVAYQKFAS